MITRNLAREFRQLFSRTEFKVSVTACFALAAINFIINLPPALPVFFKDLPGAFHNTMIFDPLRASAGQVYSVNILPVLCAFIYADSYHLEKRNGYYLSIRSRLSNSQYLWEKAFVVAVGAFFISMLPFLLDQLFACITYPLVNTGINIALTKPHFPTLQNNFPLLNNLVYILFNGIYGSLLALLTFSISLYVKWNRVFILLASPVISIWSIALLTSYGLFEYNTYVYLFAAPLLEGARLWKFLLVISLMLAGALIAIAKKVKKDDL